jgi:tetratricopeptide (TPR) repeat protein
MSLAVAAVIIALGLVDISLEQTEQNELAAQALRADRNGQQLLRQGHAPEAVDAFRKAHSLERENTKYALDLIQALMAAGKLTEAQPLMTEILEEESNNGEANLIAARLAAKQGHITAADSHYHRALYGEWPDDLARHQIEVRLELIDFLNAHGKQQDTLAELLPLEEQAGKDMNLQPRLAKLFLIAGSPGRAADIYRELIRRDTNNSGYYAGLGETELAMGDFRAARAAFSSAESHGGKDGTMGGRLALATMLSNLDPTPRWLSEQDKYWRSVQILQLASSDLRQCITNHPQLATDDATQLVTTAQTQLASPAPQHLTNELAEGVLSLAERSWRTRNSLCSTGTAPDEEPLRLIMDKLAK